MVKKNPRNFRDNLFFVVGDKAHAPVKESTYHTVINNCVAKWRFGACDT